MNDDRQRSMEIALTELEKAFGKGVVMRFGDKAASNSLDVIPTGSIGLDIALGVGGLPRGRIIEIYGPESSGKTTVTLHIIAEVQRLGGVAVFVDAEHALDPTYAKNLGVNIDDLYISQPDDGEQALDIVDMMVRSGAVDLVVVDSVAALVPRAEIEGDMGASHVGLHARLMSQALRKITAFGNRSKCIVLFTNQLREKIGVTYGSNEVTTGGRALKFYASIRLDIRKVETLKAGDEQVANRTRVKVVKNKVAPPFRQCEFDIVFGKGISKEGDVLDLGVESDIVNKSGSWYNYGEQRLGQGRENAKLYLKEHAELLLEIENAVREKNGLSALDDLEKMREAFMAEPKESRVGKADKKAGKKKKSSEKSKQDNGDDDTDIDSLDD